MPRKPQAAEPLPTIWEVPDDLWSLILPILQEDWQPSGKEGQPPAAWRPMLNGIIYRMRTGCQWNRLPREFGDDSTIHRPSQSSPVSAVVRQRRVRACLVNAAGGLRRTAWR